MECPTHDPSRLRANMHVVHCACCAPLACSAMRCHQRPSQVHSSGPGPIALMLSSTDRQSHDICASESSSTLGADVLDESGKALWSVLQHMLDRTAALVRNPSLRPSVTLGHITTRPRGDRYFMIFGGGALLAFGLPARPETSYVRAARDEAAKRLKEEGVI